MNSENRSDSEAESPECADRTADVHRHLDRVFEVLADRRRRLVLSYLVAEDADAATVGELLDYVVARSGDTSTDRDADTVRTQLHHNHLPKLDAAGVIDYDAGNGTVRYREKPFLEEYLDLTDELVRRARDV